jgi:hypothetical protein
MFDRMKENAKYKEIKQHVDDNKLWYVLGAGIATGVVGRSLYHSAPVTIANSVAPIISPVFNNDNSSMVNFGGHLTKIVRCIETDEMWPTVTKSAKATGNTLNRMSQHLNGHRADLNGLHYVIEGVGTTG